MDIKYTELFCAKYEKDTKAYKHYIEVLEEIIEKYGCKFDLRPKSQANAKRGENRGINFYFNDKFIYGIHVNIDNFKFYIIDERCKAHTKYELICTEGKNEYVVLTSLNDIFEEIDRTFFEVYR